MLVSWEDSRLSPDLADHVAGITIVQLHGLGVGVQHAEEVGPG